MRTVRVIFETDERYATRTKYVNGIPVSFVKIEGHNAGYVDELERMTSASTSFAQPKKYNHRTHRP